MMAAPYFSVIMPVYGVEDYLDVAVKSVLAQTYSDFELILVHDCSPDRSGIICDNWVAKDQRVKVIHMPVNVGLSRVRNAGIREAQGKYVFFMDSDDTIDETLLTSCAESLIKNPAQAVVFGMTEEYFDNNGQFHHSHIVKHEECLFDNQEEARNAIIHLEEMGLYGYSCNKVYDLSIIKEKNINFEVVTLIEDIVFNVAYFMHVTTLNILGTAPYYYKKRLENSLTSRFVKDYFPLHERRVLEVLNQYRYFGLCTDDVKMRLGNIYFRYLLSGVQRNCDKRSNMNHNERKQFLKGVFCSTTFETLAPSVKPVSLIAKISYFTLQKKWVLPSLAIGCFTFFVKTKLPLVFAKLKQNR
jgi:glycosyltransferase involved in cell wall biosynthesis